MPREHIIEAMQMIADETFANTPNRTNKITVPHSKNQKAFWGVDYEQCDKYRSITFNKQNLIDILAFAIDNAFTRFRGNIIKQVKGIPQGDSLSPAIAVGTCAFFEKKWFDNKSIEEQKAFSAYRYIDDVLGIIDKGYEHWEALASDYKNNCYPKELELTEDDNSHFLECEIIPNKGRIESKHWNKNAGLSKQIYYKGKHANSIGSIDSKIGAIMGTFLRIKRNCTTNDLFKIALNEKIQELRMIGYSGTTLKNIKYCLLTRHSDPSWK